MNSSWSEMISATHWPEGFVIPSPGAMVSAWEDTTKELFPTLAPSLSITPQDPVYHGEGDVWTHTKMVVQALLDDPGYAALDQSGRGVVFYAALLHDISKATTTIERDGKIMAPGHSQRGAIDVRNALWEYDVPFTLREQVCRLVESHQLPFFAFNSRRGTSPEFTVRQQSVDRSIDLLCMLAKADMVGRYCQDQAKILDEIELFREQAIELGCLDNPYLFPDSATRHAYFQSAGQRYADEPVFQEKPFEVVMLSGLPASGKTTWTQDHPELPVVSYDAIRSELGLSHGENIGTVIHAADDRMRIHLRARRPFVIDATHLSRQMRQRSLALVDSYGGQVRAVYLEVPRSLLLSRNHDRDSALSNTKLARMTSRWEVPGHDEIQSVDYHVQVPKLNPRRSPRNQ